MNIKNIAKIASFVFAILKVGAICEILYENNLLEQVIGNEVNWKYIGYSL